jgi:Cu-processing system permease protein
MSVILKVARYELENVLRSRWVLAYGLFFGAASELLLLMAGSGPRALLALVNVVVLLVPLVTIVFGTIYWHSSREFTELLLAQPVQRSALFHGLFAGLVLPLSAAFALGVALPLLWHRALDLSGAKILLLLLFSGTALTAVFGALAVLIGGLVEDRLRGLALALGLWLLFTVVYDGLLLYVSVNFSSYPLEGALLGLTFANPVDLVRVLLVLRFDVAALMGYTGALFNKFLGTALGTAVALGGLLAWALVPGLLALRAFKRKDF